MDIREQIEWLRGLGGDVDGTAAGIADTMEKLLAVYEAADYIVNHLTIDRVYGDGECFVDCRRKIAALKQLESDQPSSS